VRFALNLREQGSPEQAPKAPFASAGDHRTLQLDESIEHGS
jgi:hypothetical protein